MKTCKKCKYFFEDKRSVGCGTCVCDVPNWAEEINIPYNPRHVYADDNAEDCKCYAQRKDGK
jgi:hypothetical protein